MSNVSYSTPVSRNAETTFELKPHLGSSGDPFMNSNMFLDSANIDSILLFVLSVFAFVHVSIARSHSVLSVPSEAISKIISFPPANSPFKYNCGYVGQSENTFKPCRTFSSDKISNVPYAIPQFVNASLDFLENPHCGDSRFPFMNKTTGCTVVKCTNRFCNSSSVSFLPLLLLLLFVVSFSLLAFITVVLFVALNFPSSSTLFALEKQCIFTARVNCPTSAPSIVFTTLPLFTITNVGTEVTSYFSADSSSTSASQYANALEFSTSPANASIASFIALHGAHHSAPKCTTTSGELSTSEERVWSSGMVLRRV
mmetsp:Transcript_8659/g.27808  ORF Transcript_8659/g.27808 Transcript_8659/m.27808 type:complete len:313 (+) Transcript_8659:2883-3821(+)